MGWAQLGLSHLGSHLDDSNNSWGWSHLVSILGSFPSLVGWCWLLGCELSWVCLPENILIFCPYGVDLSQQGSRFLEGPKSENSNRPWQELPNIWIWKFKVPDLLLYSIGQGSHRDYPSPRAKEQTPNIDECGKNTLLLDGRWFCDHLWKCHMPWWDINFEPCLFRVKYCAWYKVSASSPLNRTTYWLKVWLLEPGVPGVGILVVPLS